MKKHLITMLLALMLALLCVPAMAEVTVETITYDNGAVYIGQVADGQPNGKGTYTFADGGSYTGDVVNGARTVVEAVAHSKIVAQTMHEYMQSKVAKS